MEYNPWKACFRRQKLSSQALNLLILAHMGGAGHFPQMLVGHVVDTVLRHGGTVTPESDLGLVLFLESDVLSDINSDILSDIDSEIKCDVLSGKAFDILAYLLAFYLAFYLTFVLAFYLAFYFAFNLAFHLAFYLSSGNLAFHLAS